LYFCIGGYMISDWKKTYKAMIKLQAGYKQDLSSIGESYKGIVRKVWSKWPGWVIIDFYKKEAEGIDIKVNYIALQDKRLKELVELFYKEKFWNKIHGDELPVKLAKKLFHTAIDVTVPISILILQRAINTIDINYDVFENGVYNKETDLAVKDIFKKYEVEGGQDILIKWCCKYQAERYHAITTRYPKQRTFLKGRLEKALYQGD